MDRTPLLDLVAELLAAIRLLAGYPIPDRLPEIHVVPPAEIQRLLCKGHCGIKAFYLPDKGIFVSDTADPAGDVLGRSILLHELVHHVQHVTGKFDRVSNACERWYSKEREAYEVQNAYLREQGERRRFALDSLPHMCADGKP